MTEGKRSTPPAGTDVFLFFELRTSGPSGRRRRGTPLPHLEHGAHVVVTPPRCFFDFADPGCARAITGRHACLTIRNPGFLGGGNCEADQPLYKTPRGPRKRPPPPPWAGQRRIEAARTGVPDSLYVRSDRVATILLSISRPMAASVGVNSYRSAVSSCSAA